jgi:predicted dehydrogenase
VKIGTVGTNTIGSSVLEAARRTGGIEIAAAYSRSAENAAAFAARHGIKKAFSDREAFLGDRELDFVYVASPNSLHYPWTLDALRAGRNVICEKPFVPNAACLEKLAGAAEEGGLFLFEAMTVPHLPNFRLIKECLPRLGRIRFADLAFSQYSSRYPAYLRGENPNIFSPEFSGGALMDLNCYNLAFILGLFGEPGRIEYHYNRGKNGIDTSGALVLEYSGFLCLAAACKDSAGRCRVEIQGEDGYIFSDSAAGNLRTGFTLKTKDSEEFFNRQDTPNVLYYELLDFEEIFRSGDRNRCRALLEESLKAARLMEKARKGAGLVFRGDPDKGLNTDPDGGQDRSGT